MATKDADFRDASQNGQWGREGEYVTHFRLFAWELAKVVIVCHGTKDSAHHDVAKIVRAFQTRDFAREFVPHPKMPGAPGDTLAFSDQPGYTSRTCNCRLPEVSVAEQMYFDASSEVEA